MTEVNTAPCSLLVTCGVVPQGSVLRPLLFLLHINNIYNSVSDGKTKLSADDTNMFISGKTLSGLKEKANVQISGINKWITANKLHLNTEKTCYTTFSPHKSYVPAVSLKAGNVKIEHVERCKYLEVIIDSELKWKLHIDLVTQKLKRLVGTCYKLRYKLPD